MRQLYALWSSGRTRRVIDRRGGVLVGIRPVGGFNLVGEKVLIIAEYETVSGVNVVQHVSDGGVCVDHVRAAIFDDVADFAAGQSEVDGHEDPTPARHAKEGCQQSG